MMLYPSYRIYDSRYEPSIVACQNCVHVFVEGDKRKSYRCGLTANVPSRGILVNGLCGTCNRAAKPGEEF